MNEDLKICFQLATNHMLANNRKLTEQHHLDLANQTIELLNTLNIVQNHLKLNQEPEIPTPPQIPEAKNGTKPEKHYKL